LAAHKRVIPLLAVIVVVGSAVFAHPAVLASPPVQHRTNGRNASVLPASGDTWIRINTQANYGDWSTLEVGASSVRDSERVLLQFDLGAVPPDAVILAADLHVFYERCGSLVYCRDMTVSIHRVTVPWEEMTATGANLWDAIDPATQALQVVGTEEDTWITWDVLPLVQQWHSGAFPNNGLALQAVPSIVESYKQFAAREKGDGWAAHLVVTWEAGPAETHKLFLPLLNVSSIASSHLPVQHASYRRTML